MVLNSNKKKKRKKKISLLHGSSPCLRLAPYSCSSFSSSSSYPCLFGRIRLKFVSFLLPLRGACHSHIPLQQHPTLPAVFACCKFFSSSSLSRSSSLPSLSSISPFSFSSFPPSYRFFSSSSFSSSSSVSPLLSSPVLLTSSSSLSFHSSSPPTSTRRSSLIHRCSHLSSAFSSSQTSSTLSLQSNTTPPSSSSQSSSSSSSSSSHSSSSSSHSSSSSSSSDSSSSSSFFSSSFIFSLLRRSLPSSLLSKLSAYFHLSRLHAPIGSWLLFWPCAHSALLALPATPHSLTYSLASSAYIREQTEGSTLHQLIQAWKDRHLPHSPPNTSPSYEAEEEKEEGEKEEEKGGFIENVKSIFLSSLPFGREGDGHTERLLGRQESLSLFFTEKNTRRQNETEGEEEGEKKEKLFAPIEDLWGVCVKSILLCGCGSILMRSAGCIINDLTDRHLDAQVSRTRNRPLASGRLSPKEAFFSLFLHLLLSLFILLQFNPLTVLVALSSMFLVCLYPFMKRVTSFPQAVLGLTFNWGALVGWISILHSFHSSSSSSSSSSLSLSPSLSSSFSDNSPLGGSCTSSSSSSSLSPDEEDKKIYHLSSSQSPTYQQRLHTTHPTPSSSSSFFSSLSGKLVSPFNTSESSSSSSSSFSSFLSPCISLYLSSVFWTLTYDTIYAHQDKRDDVKAGIKSTALFFGDKKTPFYISIFSSLYAVGLIFTGLQADMSWPYYAVGVGGCLAQLLKQSMLTNLNDTLACAKAFRSNHTVGVTLFLGILASKVYERIVYMKREKQDNERRNDDEGMEDNKEAHEEEEEGEKDTKKRREEERRVV
ncbi:4-hydroxybenzoate polyprenyl transferase [Cystoisospora suis]|uniref:4-hydroxybenzoate polyprenyltransferase, mitochondrial n=1 Tax=Cystoisospora suis TaxID=483139 RepID=A0A2C6L1S0_9APIC|nr:4-hydroxybenzoate polyprenyl transferase [Cystoisospora suis]